MSKSMTYGTLPSREEFNAAYGDLDKFFSFRNDSRVGTCSMDGDKLWAELEKARKEWWDGQMDRSGDWCSDVLSVLGFEWI